MSVFRQGNQAEAGESFAKAVVGMPALPTNELNPLRNGAGPIEIVVWLAYKEAKAKLPEEVRVRGQETLIKVEEEALAQSRKDKGSDSKEAAAAAQKLADAYVFVGRSDESLPLLAEISRRSPQDTLLSLKVAALQVWFGRNADHLTTCQRLIERAEAAPDDGYTSERAAKAWCLQDSSDPALLERVLKLAHDAADH